MKAEHLYSIRGATTADGDTAEQIQAASIDLMREIIERNGLQSREKRVLHIVASSTKDITAFYPVRAIRESGLIDAPLFSCLEPDIHGALPLCIRLLVQVADCSGEEPIVHHVYRKGAVCLRADIAAKEENA